jgi:hypothetical protein
MWHNEDEEKLKDLEVNTLFILELQMTNKSMSNKYRSEGFRIQRSKVDLSIILVESTKVFTQSSCVLT